MPRTSEDITEWPEKDARRYSRRFTAPSPPNNNERHFQTGIQVVIIALLAWFANKTIDTSDSLIRMELTVENMAADISQLTHSVKDNRYTATDAAKDEALDKLRMAAIIRRIEALELGERHE